MKKIIIAKVLILVCAFAYSQNLITGTFSELDNQKIKLVGFNGFDTYTIDNTKADENGVFSLKYSKNDYGMGYLLAEDNKSFIVILTDDKLILKGNSFAIPETIEIIQGKENQLFEQYTQEYPRREQALSAWLYLQKIYQGDSLFAVQNKAQEAIKTEMQRIKQEDLFFLNNLDANTYISWYLPVRKLVSSVSSVAQYRTEEIPATFNAFRKMDYTDKRLYKSGLYKEVISSHFWLIENSGRSLDSVYIEMNISIDYLIENINADENKFNEITKYLFFLLEEHSLYQSSEYLALKILTQNSCMVNDDFAKQLELYRAMKKGNTAPDIVFSGDVLKDGSIIKSPKRLSDIQSDYKIVIFAASWCQKCTEELSQLLLFYPKWKSKGVEVVFISLDNDEASFKRFANKFPFISMCTYKNWETKAAKDYFIFATPTMFLLDKNQQIILQPKSIKQIDAWVDFYLGEPQ